MFLLCRKKEVVSSDTALLACAQAAHVSKVALITSLDNKTEGDLVKKQQQKNDTS